MSTVTLSGSCLCGGVSYRATGLETRFYHCHCKRCRKVSGTGHCSNLFMEGELAWLSGEELLGSYMPPGARVFRNLFCKRCGSRMPRFDEENGRVFIPAGSLDQEPTIRPEARIFCGSKAAWSCHDGEIPEHEEYRTRN